jgi:hypothetical protein
LSDYRDRADLSDERAKRLNIDPPRPGRKTYQKCYKETIGMSTADILTMVRRRDALHQESGVANRVLADRGL